MVDCTHFNVKDKLLGVEISQVNSLSFIEIFLLLCFFKLEERKIIESLDNLVAFKMAKLVGTNEQIDVFDQIRINDVEGKCRVEVKQEVMLLP